MSDYCCEKTRTSNHLTCLTAVGEAKPELVMVILARERRHRISTLFAR